MNFWAGRSVCVTGGAGFLGSRVVARLSEVGASVFVPVSAEYDLRTGEAAERCMADSEPEIVVHLAGRTGGIGANRTRPGEFFYDNLMMGAHVIEQARLAGVRKLVALGTVCCYPKFAPVPFREDDLWNGYPEETNAGYGLAKKMMLVQLDSYRRQYAFCGVFLLPTNLYGPGDDFDLATSHAIPAIVRRMTHARDHDESVVVLWGDGTPTRDFLFVEDAADAIVAAAERYDAPEPVNLGSGREVSSHELANIIAREVGYEGAVVWDASMPNGQPRRVLDTSRALRGFGWAATTSLEVGVALTAEWWEQHRDSVEAD